MVHQSKFLQEKEIISEKLLEVLFSCFPIASQKKISLV
jgi:hypothetical protein